jgi:diguanylate cyclase (GGDEF)-like protein
VIVLTRDGSGEIVASSHPCIVGTGQTLAGLGHAYIHEGAALTSVVSGRSSLRLVTLVDHDRLAALDDEVLGLSRQQRFLAALAFIGLFTLVILINARRIERLRARVEGFMQSELSSSPSRLRSGDQIKDLEQRFIELIDNVLRGREAMRRNYQLQAHVDQLEVLYAVTERLSVGVMSIKGHHAVAVNATMQRFVDDCGGIDLFHARSETPGRLELACRQECPRVFDMKSLATGAGERVVLVRDITEVEEQRAALEFQSLHDGLTALPNRVLLNDRLEQAVAAAQRNHAAVTLVLIDLNRFKDVNDSLGHQAGDEVLRRVVDRFHATIRVDDTLARIGGDEFAVVLRDCDTREAYQVCDKLSMALHEPMLIADHKVAMDISIGLAGFPRDAVDAETLMRRADVALAHAKATRQPFCSFDSKLDATSKDRLLLMAELRDALRNGGQGLLLHFQPQVDLTDGSIRSVEALVRWDHPTRGMVPPGAFVPMVEESPLINHLSRWVIEEALRRVVHWRKTQPQLRVAVNLSTRNLADPGLVPFIVDRLGQCGAPAEALVLEITESAIMWDPARARAILQTLQAMGIGISIDDFGTGHSSLAYLSRLPVSELKIDRTFVQGMLSRAIDRTIVHATVDLGDNLGLQVVAEGVETVEELDLLRSLGCDLVQGYLLARPIPATDLGNMLQAGSVAIPTALPRSTAPKLVYPSGVKAEALGPRP